jgi:hypothetical protein
MQDQRVLDPSGSGSSHEHDRNPDVVGLGVQHGDVVAVLGSA